MIYLNQAATTYPKPQCVQEAHTASIHICPQGQFRSSVNVDNEDVFVSCKKKLGQVFGIGNIERIYFSSGATDSSNAVIYGLGLENSHVIATQTEHNSILRPLMNLKEQVGEVDIVPCDQNGKVSIETIQRTIKSNTKALFLNHCSNVTGMIQDVERISKLCREKKILLVLDAAQSGGCIPVYVDKWEIDVLIFTGHKALFGVQGTGGYYIKKGVEFKPFRFGGTGSDSRRLIYDKDNYEFETGTQNMQGIIALNAGLTYILDRGIDKIAQTEKEHIIWLYKKLQSISTVVLYGQATENFGPVISFNIKGLKPADTAYILQNGYGIVVRTGHHCAPLIHEAMGTAEFGTVRVSISDLTKENELAVFVTAVEEIAKSAGELNEN